AAVRAGADDLIRKPLSKTVLVEAVNRFLSYDVLRDLPRVNVSAPIRLMSDRREGWGTVRNLSRRGMFIETDQSLTPQSLVNLHFTLPHQDADLLPVAQVRWTRASNDHPAGIGVRFVELNGGTTLKLEDFVFERSLAEQAPLIGAPL
ncbi:MAG: PilZ domain-containing protein, partial [Hyphomicrobiaceae bacterium]|nr:PilZ domain-containing protein [Hyphomicrobiaceae bacterium]